MRELLVLLLVFLTVNAMSQSLKIRSPLRFLALGDSYTIGEGVPAEDSWPGQFVSAVTEMGVVTDKLTIIAQTGWRTDNLMNAVDFEQPDSTYNLVSLLIGVNNQYQGKDIEEYPGEFRTLVETAIAHCGGDTSGVFVISIPDYGFTPFGLTDQAFISAQIDQYNKINRTIAQEMGVAYFDITPISREAINKPEYLASDNLHPSGEMYAEWIKLILNSTNVELIVSNAAGFGKMENLVVYPNPANEILNFRLTQPGKSITIYNSLGAKVLQKVITDKEFSIDISSWNDGIYFFRINNKEGTNNTGKIVKN